MKKLFYILFIILPILANAQDHGIKFETNMSWSAIKAKAKHENKFIFVDCYATWCGPCKWMAANIFSEHSVGEFMNSQFINVEVQMDRTAKDDQEVKNWYADAKSMEKDYAINSYPSFLFFSPEGQIVHKFSATTKNGDEFIEKAKEALNPETQYYTFIENVAQHKTDSAFLEKALDFAAANNDATHILEIGNYFFDCINDRFNKENLYRFRMIDWFVPGQFQKGYDLFFNNNEKIDKIMDQPFFAEKIVMTKIWSHEILPQFVTGKEQVYWISIKKYLVDHYPSKPAFIDVAFDSYQNLIGNNIWTDLSSTSPQPQWGHELKAMHQRYPAQKECVDSVFLRTQLYFCAKKQFWKDYTDAVCIYLKTYDVDGPEANGLIWDAFNHSNDKKALIYLDKYMEKVAAEQSTRDDILDTYANLEYKIGHVNNAIVWENKALEIAKENLEKHVKDPRYQAGAQVDRDDIKQFTETLKKMNDGMPTWDDI